MFLEFPNLGGMLDSMRSPRATTRRLLQLPRSSRFFILPILLLALGAGCHHSSSSPSDPGTPPVITAGPVDASTVSGRPVSFTVTVTGAPTLRYQWAKEGVNILGALGATFTLYAPQPKDAGHYAVTITNPNGIITSAAAVLTVVPALSFSKPVGIVADALGNLFVSDQDDHTIWKVSPANQKTLLAGSSGLPGSTDGQGALARFNHPGGLAVDPAGNLVVADTGNHTIRRIAPDGTVTTLAGSPGLPGSADGVAALARFNAPFGLAIKGTGGVYISDSQNHTIRFLDINGTVTTYAGTAGMPGSTNGGGTNAQFDQPNGLALAPNGTLYVADYGNSCIRVIAANAQVSTLVGHPNAPGFLDGDAATALFSLPVGIALDAAGVLWVSDTHNHAIRRVTTDGVVSLAAGSGLSGNADGSGAVALFNLPCGIVATTPSGNLVVADTYNHILRLVTPAGVVTTL